ncbi:hypothetical protein EV363DRAFT_1158771, partial [Boletus edulis]
DAIAEAINCYHVNQANPEKKSGLQKICRVVQTEWRMKLKDNNIIVSHDTVSRRLQANAENFAWLSLEEEQNMVTYLLKLANHGFPPTYNMKLHVDNILHACLSEEEFSQSGIGHNWTNHFLTQHAKKIGKY